MLVQRNFKINGFQQLSKVHLQFRMTEKCKSILQRDHANAKKIETINNEGDQQQLFFFTVITGCSGLERTILVPVNAAAFPFPSSSFAVRAFLLTIR